MATALLARAYRDRMTLIRAATVATAAASWDTLDEWRDPQAETFAPRATATVEAGQRRAALLTAAYLSRSAGEDLTIDPSDHVGAAARAGVDTTEVLTRPFRTVWTALAAGQTLPAAVAAGRAQLVANASVAVQLAMRSAAGDAVGRSERIVGYRRTLTGRSCAFCATAATQRYTREDLMPLHHHCDCGIAPIIGDRDPGRVLNAEQSQVMLRDLKAQGPEYWRSRHFEVDEDGSLAFPDIEVHDHGELGPVLTGAGHHFTEI